MPSEQDNDFMRGEQAHARGSSRSSNPFSREDRRYFDWDMGWCSADNPVESKKVHTAWLYCDHCGKRSDLRTCPVQRPLLPNTFTPLRDLDRVQWQCEFCKVWQ